MQACLLTVADPEVGLGHLYRCDALAAALAQQGVATTLIVACSAGHNWLAARAPETPWEIASWNQDATATKSAIGNAHLVVVDAYDIAPEVQRIIQNAAENPVYFDDYGATVPERGVLINGSPGAGLIGYPERPGLTLLLGTDYQVLRPPFWNQTTRTVRETVQSVGVMLGGTDHHGLMNSVLSVVRRAVPQAATVYAVGVNSIPGAIDGVYPTGRLTAQEVKSMFDSLDLLITAAGQTVAEAVSCALPTIMIQTADNQEWNMRGWVARNSAKFVGSPGEYGFVERLVTQLGKLLHPTERLELAASAAECRLSHSTISLANRILAIRATREHK